MATTFTANSSTRLHNLKTQLLPSLNENQRIAIYLRYWENLSILEIAKFLRLSWDETDRLIEGALSCLKDQLLSENKREPIAA